MNHTKERRRFAEKVEIFEGVEDEAEDVNEWEQVEVGERDGASEQERRCASFEK